MDFAINLDCSTETDSPFSITASISSFPAQPIKIAMNNSAQISFLISYFCLLILQLYLTYSCIYRQQPEHKILWLNERC